MKKIVFYIAALLILLTAASGNAFCQAVMTMTTETNTKKVKVCLDGSGKATINCEKRKNYIFQTYSLMLRINYING